LLANIVFTPILSLITVLSFTGICFLLNPILSFLSYIFDLSQKLPFISTHIELDFTSLVLIWITNIGFLTFLLKDFKPTSKNIIIKALSSKQIQLSIAGSAFLLFLASSMPPLYIQELEIRNAKIQNEAYKKFFYGDFDYRYFDIKGHKALIINNLPSIEIIKNDIHEVNFLFIPKLNNNFIYLDKLIHFLKPQITVIKAKSQTDKVKLNLDLIASETNTLYDSGHIFLSKNKYWKITN